ncbi:Fatty acyl-CoA reductase [Planctomycetes bacterium MalM25]|nr:Fatty acyl-CoA reductase [Planctomycetes bacterium MalM25]
MAVPTPDNQPTADELARVAELLQCVAEDRSLLAVLDGEQRQRLLRYANQVALPDRTARRKLRKARAQQEQGRQDELREADEQTLAQTGIRRQYSVRQLKRAEPPAPGELVDDGAGVINGTRPATPNNPDQAWSGRSEPGRGSGKPPHADDVQKEAPRLNVERCCYTCKAKYDRVHHFYDALCPECAELNWTKRNQTCDLTGRYALVTGGRVKIGYQAALKLLRAGAHVVVLTRFPRDGARRFLEEDDSGDWRDRLTLHGVDLRDTPAVESLADHLLATLPRLDFLLNNACQTVRRPPGFYAHLMEGERRLARALPSGAKALLESHESLRHDIDEPTGELLAPDAVDNLAAKLVSGGAEAAELSQLVLTDEDQQGGESLFPEGHYDHDQQQIDLRDINSWRLRLAEVSTVELLEVQLVNAVAPFILNARLKPLMSRFPSRDKHIVNVSAMEGVFYRAYKTDKHPHTNMAKAALNMMTRTSAQDYAADGIHMNAVDTGWITDEDPAHIAARKKEDLGFHPPLDIVDAAARICAPLFDGLITGEHVWGKFLKDYQVSPW